MANKDGVITRKDVITEEAIKWGETYGDYVKKAIESNKEFAKSLKDVFNMEKSLKDVRGNNSAYMVEKQKMNLSFQEAINNLKLQEQAEISANKAKKSAIDLIIAERRERNLATKQTLEERIEQQLANKAEREAILEKMGLITAYDKLNKARTEAKNKLRDLIASEEASTEAIKEAQIEFEALDSKVKKADQAVGDFTKNVGNYPTVEGFSDALSELAANLGVAFGISELAGALQGAYKTISEFEQGVADLKAITGATGKDLEYLKSQAIEVGKSTKGGAVQVVEAYKLIASAKPELLENVEALNSVTKATLVLSKAAGMELPDAATALTDAMNQFGADADQASRFIDALANGAKYGSAEIPEVTEALLKFGAVAKSSNISIEESTALIELLAEKGIKGAEAGTALRNVLLKISAPDALPKEAKQVMEDLGISMEKLKDNTIPIQTRFEMLKPLLADNAYLVKIFGQENIVAARDVLENTKRLKELTSKMREYGTAQKQAEERTNTLQGKTERLSATYDSFILNLNQGKGVISSFFGFLIDGAEAAIEDITRLNTSWDKLFEKARQEGKDKGKNLFQQRFNSLLGTGSEEEISKTIKKVANDDYIRIKNALKDVNEKIKEINPYALRLTGPSPKDLKLQKEQLLKDLKEQEEIIKQANIRIEKAKNPVKSKTEEDVKAPVSTSNPEDERKKAEEARKKRLEILKQLNADEFELNKQRLEQAIEINKGIYENEKETDDLRLAALDLASKKETDLYKLIRDYKKNLENESYEEAKRENSGNKANLEAIEKQHVANLKRINEEYRFDKSQAEKEAIDTSIKIRQFDEMAYKRILESKLADLEISMNSELQKENERFKDLGDLQKLSLKEREKAQEEHEKNILNIKKKYAIEGVKLQISNIEDELNANDILCDDEKLSADRRQKIAVELSEAKLKLSELEVEKNQENNKKKEYSDREWAKSILDVSQGLTNSLADLTNAIFDARIQRIDDDIKKNDEYYNKQIELAGNDQRKKKLIQDESEKQRKVLEEKKRKEQEKQAIFNKAVAATNVLISTAQAIMQSYAQMGPIAGNAGAILAGVMGAIQLAAVLAAPLPKYKMGRKGGPAEWAYTGDGGVHEVVEKADKRAYLTPNRSTLTFLEEGDTVYSSVDAYKAAQKASLRSSISMQGKQMSDYNARKILDKTYDEEILSELKKLNSNKKPIINNINIDLGHSSWRNKNTSWD